jgi:hypothetical protein
VPRIDVGSTTLNYTGPGSGDSLLFIPGLVGVHAAWEYQLAYFTPFERMGRVGRAVPPRTSAVITPEIVLR